VTQNGQIRFFHAPSLAEQQCIDARSNQLMVTGSKLESKSVLASQVAESFANAAAKAVTEMDFF
jgi:hypothetical protein